MYKGRSFDAPEMRNYDKSKVGGVGDVRVLTNLSYNLILKFFFYVLDLRVNFMSISDLNDRGYVLKLVKSE